MVREAQAGAFLVRLNGNWPLGFQDPEPFELPGQSNELNRPCRLGSSNDALCCLLLHDPTVGVLAVDSYGFKCEDLASGLCKRGWQDLCPVEAVSAGNSLHVAVQTKSGRIVCAFIHYGDAFMKELALPDGITPCDCMIGAGAYHVVALGSNGLLYAGLPQADSRGGQEALGPFAPYPLPPHAAAANDAAPPPDMPQEDNEVGMLKGMAARMAIEKAERSKPFMQGFVLRNPPWEAEAAGGGASKPKVTHLAVGNYHTLVGLDNGEVWVGARKLTGRFSRNMGMSCTRSSTFERVLPALVEPVPVVPEPATDGATTGSGATGGKAQSSTAKPAVMPPARVVALAACEDDACVVALDGGVYCWGDDRTYDNFHSKGWEHRYGPMPRRLKALDGLEVVEVAVSKACKAVARTASGDIYDWWIKKADVSQQDDVMQPRHSLTSSGVVGMEWVGGQLFLLLEKGGWVKPVAGPAEASA